MRMVKRMVGPTAMSANALSREVGVSQSTLSRWLREARTVSTMHDKTPEDTSKVPAAVPQPAKRPSDWTPDEKMAAVVAATGLEGEALGAFLRREGLHQADIEDWRQTATRSLAEPKKRRRGNSADTKRIRTLERELQRKEKALAETAALLVLQGKVQALWGEEGDATTRPNAKKS
jgi:transposase